MNKFISSAFAALLAFTSIAANANTHIAAAENTAQVTALSSSADMAVSTSVIMRIKVQLPDGSITFKKGRFTASPRRWWPTTSSSPRCPTVRRSSPSTSRAKPAT